MEPGRSDHQLPFDPFKSCVVPRPIGWISTTSADGIYNLAPFSQFQNVSFDPPTVLFIANQRAGGGRKDSVVNAEQRREFVWNMATYALREAVNMTSEEFAPSVDEFERAGPQKAASRIVRPPRVAQSPVQFECAYLQTLRLPGNSEAGTVDVVFGRVLAIHIDDAALSNGRVDIARLRPGKVGLLLEYHRRQRRVRDASADQRCAGGGVGRVRAKVSTRRGGR